MNGLNSLGLHVGVELIFLLAEVIGVLKELSCDWSDGLGGCGCTLSMVEVGYFVTMFIVDISVGLPWVWVRSGEPFTTAARGFAAPDRVSHHPKPEKAHKTSERNLLLYIFFLSQTFFLFVWLFVCFLKVTACVNERPCHFLLTTYLRFCVAFARLCSISKDLLARWKAQQRQRSHKGKRDACVVKFPRGIFSWYWPERRRTGFYSDSRRAREKKGAPRGRKKRERESSECCLWFARRSRDCSGSDGSASLFFSPFSLPGSARLVSPLLWAQVIGWTSIPAPEAAPVAGLRPARPSRRNPPWICTSTPPPAHASSSPCHWRRPWRDWRGDCRKDSKSQKRDSLCYTKKRE